MKYIILLSLLIVSCQAPSTRTPAAAEPDFRSSMQQLSQALTELLPKVIAENGFDSNANRESVRKNVDTLAGLVHNIDGRTEVPSKDPSLRMVSAQFKSDLSEVQKMIKEERWAAAKTRLNHITQYCIACHTMGAAQSSAYTLNLYADVPDLSHYDRARYKTAIRQFEAAIKEYEIALNDKEWAKAHPKEWENALISILTLITHVRKDPNLALEMISAFRDKGSMPPYLQSASLIWRQQAKAWDREKKPVASLANVDEWIGQAKKMKSPKYANTFLLVRSSARLHEMLAQGELKGTDEAKALYMQGFAGEALENMNYFIFPEQSYQMCIDKGGSAPIVAQCREALSQLKKRSLSL